MSSRLRGGWATVVALAVAFSGCAARPARLGDTHVGKGELYRPGRAGYDAFFEHTHEVQQDAMRSLDEEHRARAQVERATGGAAPSATALGERVVARAQKKRAGGAASDDPAFAGTLATALASEASVVKKYDAVATRASTLSTRADELLASAERDFSRRKERAEVTRELNAAKLILGAAALRTRTVSNDADGFVKAAGEARELASRDAAPATAATAASLGGKHKRVPARTGKPNKTISAPEGGRAAGASGGAPAPTPAARPATPKPSDDFNP